MNDELIPCTDELNRLKDFLADFKKPTLRVRGFCEYRPPYTEEKLMNTPWTGRG